MTATRVLCVENNPEYLSAMKCMLEMAGYEVAFATTGQQALYVMATTIVDGVLLEYDLPDATGCAVREEMKRMRPEVPILLFNGVSSQTPFLLRFFDSYLRRPEQSEDDLDQPDA